MFFSIDPNNGVAIYEQIVRQVKFAIADQTLRAGQLLPSVRVLSSQLTINPNTINRAFQQLQGEGVIEPLRGRGMIVSTGALERCTEDRQKLVADRIRSVLTEALHGGLSAKAVRAIVLEQLKQLDGNVATISSEET